MIKLTKHTIRLSYYIISLFLIIIFYYVLYGHKQYPILEKYQETIISNIKSEYGIDVSYQELHEDWHYFKPNFDIKNLTIKDNNGNELKAESVEVRLDLLYSLLNKKIKFKNISIENSNLKYSYLKPELNYNTETISIPDISDFNINKLKISNLNIDLTYNEKNYKLDNVNLKYNSSDDHAILNYNKIDFKYYFNKQKFHTFDLNFDVSDLVKTATDLNLLENLKSIGYNSFFLLNGKLNIKVNYLNQEEFDVKINLVDSELKLLKAGLKFDKINGLLFFNKKENLLTSNKINCLIQNKKCSFEIKNENGNQYLLFESLVGKEIIGKYVPFFDINNFSGETKIVGKFDFKKQTLNIDSNLKGLSINNIPLISKYENEELSLSVFTNFIKEYYVKVRLEDIQVFVDFNRNYNTQVYLNQPDISFSPIKENFYLKGELDNLDVSNTLSFVNNLKFENKNNKSSYKVELDLNYPNYLGINPERVIYRDNNGLASIDIMDDYFNGNIIYNILENKMKIEIEKFYYQTLNSLEDENKASIKEFPNIEGTIKNLNINGYKGSLSFNGYHNNNFYIIDNIKGELNKIIPNFIIKFSEESNKINTELISVNNNKLIEFKNVADILDSYNYVDTLNSEKGEVYGKLSWEGIKPNMKTLNGDISFNIENGKLNLSSTGNRVLKIFKIFEINMLKEIFKLDFDFMKKGLKYEKLSGKGNFVDGTYFIEDRIEMKSDNYNAGLSGKIDFYNEKFENKIKIDLPISQKLPTIAILSGNPAAVAGVWIADKLIGDKLNSLSSINFKINGTFENPNISK